MNPLVILQLQLLVITAQRGNGRRIFRTAKVGRDMKKTKSNIKPAASALGLYQFHLGNSREKVEVPGADFPATEAGA